METLLQDQLDICLEILAATHDGEDLSPHHLQLVEWGANNWLDELERNELKLLADDVRLGYEKPWLHGIKNVTIDNDGTVLWRETPIDQYDLSWAFTSEAATTAQRLAKECERVEAAGQEVSFVTVFMPGSV